MECPDELSQSGIGQRTRHPGPHHATQAQILDGEAAVCIHQFPGGLVHRILAGVAQRAMRAAELGHGAASVDAALQSPIALTVQPAQSLRGLPGKPWMVDARAIAQRRQWIRPPSIPTAGSVGTA